MARQSSPLAQTDDVQPVEEVTDSASSLAEQVLEALPRVGIGVGTFLVALALAAGVRGALRWWLRRSHAESFARVMSKLAGWIIAGAGLLIGITIVFPSVKPVDLLAGAGILSVAVGFAFKDILENLLAGVLLLFREPFRAGDQIEVNGMRGTVEGITVRETRLKTFDGERLIVPNADVYTNAIVVQTAFERRRTTFVVGVGYDADLDEARDVIVGALASVQGVVEEPAPEAFLAELGASTVNFEARFWTRPEQHESRVALDRALEAVKNALDEAGIDMPSETVALQATPSLAAALEGKAVTAAGGSGRGPERR